MKQEQLNSDQSSPNNYTSHVMRKPDFCVCENKNADPVHRSAPLFSLHKKYNPSAKI